MYLFIGYGDYQMQNDKCFMRWEDVVKHSVEVLRDVWKTEDGLICGIVDDKTFSEKVTKYLIENKDSNYYFWFGSKWIEDLFENWNNGKEVYDAWFAIEKVEVE